MKQLLFTVLLGLTITTVSLANGIMATQKGNSTHCKINNEHTDSAFLASSYCKFERDKLRSQNHLKSNTNDFSSPFAGKENYQQGSTVYKKFLFSVYGGLSYRFARISKSVPSDFTNYMNELKSGNHFSVDGSYFINPLIGIGLKYSQYHSKNKINSISTDFDQDGRTDFGILSDDITLSFFGPTMTIFAPSAKKNNALFSSLSIGYLSYKNDGMLIIPMQFNGSTVGLGGDLGYQIGIGNNFSLAFKLSYLLGTLAKMEKTVQGQTYEIEFEKDNYENLGRIDFSVGLVFHK